MGNLLYFYHSKHVAASTRQGYQEITESLANGTMSMKTNRASQETRRKRTTVESNQTFVTSTSLCIQIRAEIDSPFLLIKSYGKSSRHET